MADEERASGIDIQSISFRPTDTDTLVEVTYAEGKDQGRGIVVYRVMMFEARRASQMVIDIVEDIEVLVDEILQQKLEIPDTRPSASSSRVQA